MNCDRLLFRRALGLLACLLCSVIARGAEETAPDTPPGADESWQVIEMAGARVGYGHVATYRRPGDDGTEIIVTDLLTSMRIRRFGQEIQISERLHTEETDDGQLLSFRYRMDNPPLKATETIGTIRGDKLTLETHANGKTETTTDDWDPSVKSPAWQERDLDEHPLQPGESRSFPVYIPQFNQVITLTLQESGPARTTLIDGSEVDTTRVVTTHSLLLLPPIDAFVDASGEIVKTETKLLSAVTYTVDRETALKEIKDQPVDLAIQTLVKVVPIKNAHGTQRIVYRVTSAGGPAGQYPSGPTQHLERVGDNVVDVTVTAVRPGAGAAGVPQDDPPEPKYVQATRFLDCDNARVQEHASKAAAADLSPADAAVAMEKYVHSAMRDKNFASGLATASEVAESLEGDCTEHAVLLAAMLRARRIPARVAVGLVYSERHAAFGGHMWNEAYLDGVWTPLDATLGRGGIGAAHIKVADSALDEHAPTPIAAFLPMIHVLGDISLEVVSVE